MTLPTALELAQAFFLVDQDGSPFSPPRKVSLKEAKKLASWVSF